MPQKERNIFQYSYFLDKGFNYEPYLCNGCHDLMEKALNFNNFNLIKNSNLNKKSGLL